MVDLLDFWPNLLFWPAVALSVLAASFGLARRQPKPLLLAAVLVGPASAYLAMTPRFPAEFCGFTLKPADPRGHLRIDAASRCAMLNSAVSR